MPTLAIIGIGCLFPGSRDFASFWAGIVNRFDAIRDVPPTHWQPNDYLDSDPKAPDRVYAARGAFLDPIPFNPQAFGIPPSNLEATDASQLLGLIVARDALADCGYAISGDQPGTTGKTIDRSRISVILGVTGTLQLVIPLGARLGHPLWRKALREAGVDDQVAEDVVQRIADGYVPWQENSFPGLLGNVVAGRIANRFDLGGTNCVVDAACASSLSAIHLASMELTTGRADVVLTGGVDAFNDIFMFTCFSKTPALSPTGNARPFDASGDGTVLGEGLGMIVLKRLDDARRDGDRIYAILKAVGSSSDGKGNAIYAPRKEGQIEALRNAYREAQVTPDTIELVEAHGTGTRVGDATEVSALSEVYCTSDRKGPWCALGSIKSQIGHTKAAAGVAGLLKVTAALYHKVLPPTIKVEQPLDVLQQASCPFYVATEKRPWLSASDHPRRAAVSAFGFGGSNFHAVLEEADTHKQVIDWTGEVQILAFSGRSFAEVRQQVQAWPRELSWPELRLRGGQTRRDWNLGAPCRLVIVIDRDRLDLTRTLSRATTLLEREARSLPTEGIFVGKGDVPGKLAVLFPGQGSQMVGMLRDLVCHFPRAHETFALADRAFTEATGRRLVDLVYPPPAFTPESQVSQDEALRATDVTQPALGAVSLGAWRVLESFGVRGDLFAGHSYGELTALCAAGWLGERDFFALSHKRGQLMAEVGRGAGTMLAVKASADEIASILTEEGIDLVLANKNAPEQTVLSGKTAIIDRAADVFARREIDTVRLPVASAFHSQLVAEAREPFRASLNEIRLTPAAAVFANTTASPYPDDPAQARDLLAEQLARPVEWVRQIEAMFAAGASSFLEVGPGGKLTALVESILAGQDVAVLSTDPTGHRRNGFVGLASSLAWLAARGHRVDLSLWDPVEEAVAIPPRNALTVELTGANYVRPRPSRPERPVKPSPTSNGTHHNDVPSRPKQGSSTHDPSTLARALESTRESLASLQKMQEQTAQLHRQFLEGQEQAQRTVHLLVEQQQRLLQASLGLPVAPLPVLPAPSLPVSCPAPVAAPVVMPAVVAPVPSPPGPVVSTQTIKQISNGDESEKVLLEVIAEKTGYPAEMLEMSMTLDADLGIDSIKRVEILSALQERLPSAPTVKPEHLGSLHTLRDIASFLGDNQAPVSSPSAPAPTPAGSTEKVLLEVIAEKTGYPAEMLEMSMTLDADLGIDSIKRVEILSALQERLPSAPTVKPEHLGSLHTLRDIASFLAPIPCSSETGNRSLKGGMENEKRSTQDRPAVSASTSAIPHSNSLERSILVPVPLPTEDRPPLRIAAGAEVWINDDSPTLADAITDRLGQQGRACRRVSLLRLPVDARPAGFVLLAPTGEIPDDWLRNAFLAVQKAAPGLRGNNGILMTISFLDGAFGLSGRPLGREPLDGGLAGLAKTVAREWSEVHAKALDVMPELDPQVAATQIVEELFTAGPVEVGLTSEGRVTLERRVDPLASGSHIPFQPGDVVIVSGGARGVTAEVAVTLAQRFRATLVLLGRTSAPEPEPAWMAAPEDEADLKRELSRRTPGITPRLLGEQAKAHLAAREIRQTLSRIERFGTKAIYRSVDIRDSLAVARLLEEIRQDQGPIRGIIHGAGVLADARIEDKTVDQFDAVYQTKVAGLNSLLQATRADDMRAIVLFSSSTARFGRTGQVDYAIANEVLNKRACFEAGRRSDCRAVSINWGPWDGGMVTAGLKQLFASEGVGVIPLQAGADLLVEELQSGLSGPPEVVVLAASKTVATESSPRFPQALPTAFECVLDVADYPVLGDHVLDGRPVLPVALVLEWLAHAALVQNPGLTFHGCDDLRILQGVILDGLPPTVRVGAGKASRKEGLFIAPAELRSVRGDGKEAVHARAEIVLTSSLPAPPARQPIPNVSDYPHSPSETYAQGLLFHGQTLQGIERIEGCGEAGIVGWVKAAPPATGWMRQPLRQNWLGDPLVLDASFQLMILWTQEQRGAGSLPCHIGRYRQYRKGFPAEGARVVISIDRASDLAALADIDFLDGQGRLVARMEGYECVIDPSLARAFRRNALPVG